MLLWRSREERVSGRHVPGLVLCASFPGLISQLGFSALFPDFVS